ncbi:MAG TPA: YkvA family protein [Pseudomonadales bacterium]|nr:YkvA family protein [Pseudomonadales bacterium]
MSQTDENRMPAETETHTSGYEREYSETGFWAKIKDFALSAGGEVIEKALTLYYAAQSPGTPLWAKTVIYAALGYFILTVDAIPDLTPGIGFADDLGVLVTAIATVAAYLRPELRDKAQTKMKDWFGERR